MQQIIIADDDGVELSLINPAIVEEEGEDFLEEGCLSLPGIRVKISRSSTVLIKYINLEEKEIQREYSGLAARIIKHEIDHLNGIIILDYASTVERFLINKNFKML